MKIYTKTGDDGTTGLFGGARTSKADLRVEAYGTVDEANAAIGLARAATLPPATDAVLARAQSDLFEQLPNAMIGLRATRDLVDQQSFLDRGADRHARIERRVRILEDHLHAPAHRAQLAAFERADVDAVEADLAGRRLGEAQDRAPERRLAASGFADDT